MTANTNLERRLADYYASKAPGRAPDWVLGSALETIESTPQRRVLARVPWRFPDMNGLPRLAAVVIAVALLGAVGFAVLTGGGRLPTASPSAPPTTTPTASPLPTENRVRASFRQPFTYVLPQDVQIDIAPGEALFEFRVPDSGGPGQIAWFVWVQAIEGGRADPCSIASAALPLADARAALDYLKTVPTVAVTNETTTAIDGRTGLTATLTTSAPTADCPELSMWASDVDALPLRDPAIAGRVTLLDVGGETIAIHTWATLQALDWFRWADELIGSFDFEA